jgi:nucleotide-binding universal stress UspA family protein
MGTPPTGRTRKIPHAVRDSPQRVATTQRPPADMPRPRHGASRLLAAPVVQRSGYRHLRSSRTAQEDIMSERFDTIVVAVDFSETSAEAWRVGCRLAALAGSQLHLIHVSPDPLRQAWTVEAVGVDFGAISQEWQAQAELRLSRMQPEPAVPSEKITRVVVVGVPHASIVEYAMTQKADLIVLGTHGYGPIKHLLLGSVAERVVRQAPCPVLTVPHRFIARDIAREQAATTTT